MEVNPEYSGLSDYVSNMLRQEARQYYQNVYLYLYHIVHHKDNIVIIIDYEVINQTIARLQKQEQENRRYNEALNNIYSKNEADPEDILEILTHADKRNVPCRLPSKAVHYLAGVLKEKLNGPE